MDELNTLAKLFEGGHYSLYGQGQQAVDQAMQRKQADLQSVLGAEQGAQAMQPLELENKRATTRLNTSTAALNENSLQDRMKKSFYELDDMQREKVNQDMNRRFQIASAVKANGGQVPLALQAYIPQEELQYYTGPNLDKTLSIGKTFIENSPKWLDQRMKEDAATKRASEVARINAQNRLDVKKVGGGTGAAGKLSLEQYLTQLNRQIAGMEDGPEKAALQAEADRTEVQILRKIVAGRQAAQGGAINPGETAKQGTVVTNPQYEPTPTPRNNQWTPPNGWK